MKKVLIVLVVLVALFVGVFVGSNITTEKHIETHNAGYKPVKTLVVEVTKTKSHC